MLRNWYRIVAQADPLVTDLYIYDEIGKSFWNDEAVGAKQFIDDLAALPQAVQTLRLHVNSPGGDVFEAVAIANALRAQSTEKKRTVEVIIDGLAASAATIITSAGDSIKIAANALMMIHDPLALVIGPAADMRTMADLLDAVRGSIIATYRWVSSLSAETLGEMMAATTWMTPEAAVEHGFATEIIGAVQVTATFRPEALARLGQIPDTYRPAVDARRRGAPRAGRDHPDLAPAPARVPLAEPLPAPADPAEVIRACTAAGVPELTEGLVVAKAPLEQVQARIAAAKEVRGLCLTARLPELAADYITAGTPAAMVRSQLTALTARLDGIEIDGHLNPDAGFLPTKAPTANVFDLYREREERRLASLKGV